VPIFIAYAALVIDPGYAKLFAREDAREIQRILPNLILERTPLWAQVLFFGALLSAILSTARARCSRQRAVHRERDPAACTAHGGQAVSAAAAGSAGALLLSRRCSFALNSKSTMYEWCKTPTR
jgi:hypothetical protein